MPEDLKSVGEEVGIPKAETDQPITSPEKFWIEAQAAYQDDAEKIADLLGQADGVIVDAPFGTGKSKLLTPQLLRELSSRGKAGVIDHFPDRLVRIQETEQLTQIIARDFKALESFPDIHYYHPVLENPVLIIDETGNLLRGNPDLQNLLQSLKDKHIGLVAIDAAGDKGIRKRYSDQLHEEGSKTGYGFVDYFPQTNLPTSLIQRFLTSYTQDQELLAFFLNPNNEALRNARLFGDIIIRALTCESKGVSFDLAYLREYFHRQLGFSYLTDDSRSFGNNAVGGSKEGLVRMLVNLGAIDLNNRKDAEIVRRATYFD